LVSRGCNISECDSVSFFRAEWNIYPALHCFCMWSCTQRQIPERHGHNYAPGIVVHKYKNITLSTLLQHWFKSLGIYLFFLSICGLRRLHFQTYTNVEWCGGWWIGKDLKGSSRDPIIVLSHHLSEENQENNSHSRWTVSRSTFESGTSPFVSPVSATGITSVDHRHYSEIFDNTHTWKSYHACV